MPVYAYRCKSCGHELEEIQPMGSPPPGPCPECGGKLRRVWGQVGVRFSGWGFSKTDSLVSGDRPRKDFKQLKERAEKIADGD
jgi:putative FmdB family regulatory protein